MKRCGAMLASAVAVAACGGGEGGHTPANAAARRAFLVGVGERVVLPNYRSFEDQAGTLENTVAAFADDPTDETRADAQDAWRAAMDGWQFAEALQIGPAGPMGVVTGGMDLRDEIYSWPLVSSACRLDQETEGGEFADKEMFEDENVNVRGLAVLEYLLFHQDTDNTCAPQSELNAGDPSPWEVIADELVERRAEYARTLAIGVNDRAMALVDAWEGDAGFLEDLRTAGLGSDLYDNVQLGIDEATWALLYVDRVVKDMKVGVPSGVMCAGESCIDEQESRYADRSLENVAQNIVGLEAVVTGGTDANAIDALDELLADLGRSDVAEDLVEAVQRAAQAVDAIEGSLSTAVVDDPEAVEELFNALQEITDLLKADVTTALDAEPLPSGPTDND